MYLTFKIARFQFAAATKDEYLIPPDEVLLCKKGFRLSIGKYFFNCNKHESDCATYNEPAYAPEKCDCKLKEKSWWPKIVK